MARRDRLEASAKEIAATATTVTRDLWRDIVRTTKNGLEAARQRGKVDGHPHVIDDDKRAVIMTGREKGESIREIAKALGVSVGTVHCVVTSQAMA